MTANFNTYVINLEKDKENWTTLQSSLQERGVDPIRFDAIYGKEIPDLSVYDDILTKKCKYTCPYSVIGSGLSHMILGNQIYAEDPNDHTLILEDDVIPEFTNKQQIIDIIKNKPKDCDVLLLYCHGLCNGKETYTQKEGRMIGGKYGFPWFGSVAAYVMTKRALHYQRNKKVNAYADADLFTSDLNVYIYNGPQVFSQPSLEENPSANSTTFKPRKWDPILSDLFGMRNLTILQLLNFNQFRIPLLDIDITVVHIIILVFVFFYVII